MTPPPTRPQPRYEDLELDVEREFRRLSGQTLPPRRDPRVPVHPKRYRLVPDSPRGGCWIFPFLILAVLVGSSIAAPRSSSEPSPVPTTTGAPLDPASVPAAGLADVRPVGAPLPAVASTRPAATVGSEPKGSLRVQLPRPATDVVSAPTPTTPAPLNGTALYWATATWCAPTATQCQGWGGGAKLAAVHSFLWGDEPYTVRVWRDTAHVDVRVVSYCECGGSDFAIDLSPAAFRVLAALDRGRVDVAIEDLR